jgi:hypothetical protein
LGLAFQGLQHAERLCRLVKFPLARDSSRYHNAWAIVLASENIIVPDSLFITIARSRDNDVTQKIVGGPRVAAVSILAKSM